MLLLNFSRANCVLAFPPYLTATYESFQVEERKPSNSLENVRSQGNRFSFE